VKKLKNLILEQFTHLVNTSRDIDEDISEFGVSVDSKEFDGQYYTYVISGDKENVLRLVIHISGPSADKNKTAIIAPQTFSGNDSWGVY
jgi:hypothetical protein